MNVPPEAIPSIEMPLHTLIELTPMPDGTMKEERFAVGGVVCVWSGADWWCGLVWSSAVWCGEVRCRGGWPAGGGRLGLEGVSAAGLQDLGAASWARAVSLP
jgi:hypothetical protein